MALSFFGMAPIYQFQMDEWVLYIPIKSGYTADKIKKGLSYFGRLEDGEIHFCISGYIVKKIFSLLKKNII